MIDALHLSVVIPIYRAEASLVELTNRLTSTLEQFTSNYEIIMVEDCGGDGSWELMASLREKDPRIKIIRLTNNFGQHNALMCGFRFATGKYIITLDDDLQNPPEEIPKLIAKIEEGYDLVYGKCIARRHGLFRNWGSFWVKVIFRKLFSVSGSGSAFRIVRREIIASILSYDKNFVYVDGLLAWVTRNVGYAQVAHEERRTGRSGYGPGKLIALSMNLLTNFSILPLQLASLLGFAFALLGLVMAVFFFFKKVFFDIPVTGYTSLIIAVTSFAGIQLITLGLIGEYVGRIHLNINAKPQFLIRDKQI